MKIQLIVQISGSREGVDWPPPGGVIDVTAAEAADMIKVGMAKEVSKADLPPIEKAVAPKAETRKAAPRKRAAKPESAPAGLTKESLGA